MAISIDFLANVGEFLRGTKNAEGALDDVAGALDDLADEARSSAGRAGRELGSGVQDGGSDAERAVEGVEGKLKGLGDTGGGADAGDELAKGVKAGGSDAESAVDSLEGKLKGLDGVGAGSDAGDELARGVKDGGGDAEKAVDSLEGKFRTLAAAAHTQSTKVGTDVSKSVKAGTDDASEGVETLKENTGANLKEVAASFDGTWEGAAGGLQGLLAEATEGFGPAGLLVGAIGAGVLGVIISTIEGGTEASEQQKQAIAELAGEYIDAGRAGRRSFDSVAERIKAMATSTDGSDVIITLQDAWEKAKAGGADYQQIVEAIASGSPTEIRKAQDAVAKLTEEHIENAKEAASGHRGFIKGSGQVADATGKLRDALSEAEREAVAAGKAQELAARAGLSALSLKQKAIEQLQGAYSDAAGEVDDYIGKESGLFDVKKYIKAMDDRADALRDYQETLSKSSLSAEAKSFIEDQGEEQAATLIAGYKKATPEQREQLNRIWTTSGKQSASSYAEAIGDDLRGKTVPGPKVKVGSFEYKDAVQDALSRAQIYADNNPIKARVSGFADDFRKVVV